MTQKSRWPVVRRLLPYFGRVRGAFLLSLVFLLLISALTAAKALIIQPVVDTFLGGKVTHGKLYLFVGAVVAIFVVQAVLTWFYLVTFNKAGAGVSREVRGDLITRLLQHGLGYFHARPTGEITSRVVNDVLAFQAAGVGTFQALLRDIVTILWLVAVMVWQDWHIALVCVAIIVVVGLILRAMSRRVRKLARSAQDKLAKVTSQLTQVVGGIELILSFGLGRDWRTRLHGINASLYKTNLKTAVADATAVGAVLLIVALGMGSILYFTGRALIEGDLTPGQFMAIFAAMYLMQAPAQGIAQGVGNMARGVAAGARAMELLDDDPTIADPEQPKTFARSDGSVAFRGVSFRYGKLPVINNLSFTVAPGELVVMVGDSGAGKSTVAKLLLRFYDPDAGEVCVDGMALPDLLREDLYRSVSYVGQEVYLFDESVEFNLRVGRPDASADELQAVLRIACVDSFLADLPQGLETLVGERGARLSGGQRQRIAIARAILGDSRVLVLDEATSALDMDLEQQILQNLVDAPKQRTIFAITHKLSMADIVVPLLTLVLFWACLVFFRRFSPHFEDFL